MKNSFVITAVRPIFNIDKPIVVFEGQGGEAIVRNPKQALTDLQNSGRALDINAKEFARGLENVNSNTRANFISALFDCDNASLSGDMTHTKAGDTYVLRAGHPALTDPSHAYFGKVKEGDSLKAEKDGTWVEGFLTIPLTEQDKMRRDVSGYVGKAMLAMYGIGGGVPVPVAQEVVPFETEATPEDLTTQAVEGKK